MNEEDLKWKYDANDAKEITSQVPHLLATVLHDQRQKLDEVVPLASGPDRWQMARNAGCCAAVAKGARYHTLKPKQIVIPRSEFAIRNGQLRIPALKASIAVPADVEVKRVIFRLEGDNWYGALQLIDKKVPEPEPLSAKAMAS